MIAPRRHGGEHGTAIRGLVEVIEQPGVAQHVHAGLDVAAADEHEIYVRERLPHLGDCFAVSGELRPQNAVSTRAGHERAERAAERRIVAAGRADVQHQKACPCPSAAPPP